jgi:hypothetical protein
MGDVDAGPDGEPDGGADTLDTGIGLTFTTNPTLEGGYTRDGVEFTIESAEIELADVRLIGDSATGDERTSHSQVFLFWEDATPVYVPYEQAPPGMYSRVRATATNLQIEGSVAIGDEESFSLSIETEGISVPLEFDMIYELEAGSPLSLEVEVDLQRMTEEISFSDLEISEGEATIEGDSEELDHVLEKLTESFEISGPL